ncbi:hypothetical protein [Bacillus phage vB_BceM_Bc431v3]|uniref:Uncharacterized protein n=1 Tax=Bacillus phage vB_BceM_Bc431v3 TaxID=1195072 RepID=M4HNK2_9CAUD|nr:hypothetical protein K201_gp053 [Bacillus phage vB_BceM_Bc431v3]AFQ96361.1 hypothetical protein [Bacillus phage vB_BceM_Bc431v3]
MNEFEFANFTICGEGIRLKGYATIEKVLYSGGWELPYFPKESVEAYMQDNFEVGIKSWYIEETDTYVLASTFDSTIEEHEVFWWTGEKIEYDGELVHVYCLDGLTWEREEEKEMENNKVSLEEFKSHLDSTVNEIMDLLHEGKDVEGYNVTISLNGKSIEIDMNADLYANLENIIQDEIAGI